MKNFQRYPKTNDKSLQAFNAADELIVELAKSQNWQGLTGVVNDDFGAICNSINTPSLFVNDSFMSLKACQLNQTNKDITYGQFDHPIATSAQQWIIKIPKTLSLFESQLYKLSLTDKPVTACAMVKYIARGHITLMNKYFETCIPSRAVKKARTIELSNPIKQAAPSNNSYQWQDQTITALAGVFCGDKLDIGSRFFIEHLKNIKPSSNIADIGCGNGILSVAMNKIQPKANYHLFDESFNATLSAMKNLKSDNATTYWDNGLTHYQGQPFDLVLCNPPFHQSTTVGTYIAHQMFKQAAQHLSKGGELWVVANSHLDYRKILGKLFSKTEQIARNNKFEIVKATK